MALRRLQDLPGIVQSALTGNLKPLAIAKLATLGLDGYLDYDVDGYGEDHAQRYRLVEIAMSRAANKYGAVFDEDNTILIGDTLRDVQAGHLDGVPVVAVATGYTSAAELEAAGADRVLEDLSVPRPSSRRSWRPSAAPATPSPPRTRPYPKFFKGGERRKGRGPTGPRRRRRERQPG